MNEEAKQRDLDMIEDDIRAIINIKNELNVLAKWLHRNKWTIDKTEAAIDRAVIGMEESLDDLVGPAYGKLVAEHGGVEFPASIPSCKAALAYMGAHVVTTNGFGNDVTANVRRQMGRIFGDTK